MRFDSQFARMKPDVFLRVELWRTRRQRQERDVFGSLEVFGAVPSGLIENENGMCAWGNFRCDFVEMELHGFGVASGEHESSAGSALGADLLLVGLRPGAHIREAQVLQGAIDGVVRHREPKLVMQPHDQIAGPPAHHAVKSQESGLRPRADA